MKPHLSLPSLIWRPPVCPHEVIPSLMWSFLGWLLVSGSSSTLLWSLFCFKVMEQCLCSTVYHHSLHSWPSVSAYSFVLNCERFAWLLWQVNPDLERFGLIDCTEPDPPSLYLCLSPPVYDGRELKWFLAHRRVIWLKLGGAGMRDFRLHRQPNCVYTGEQKNIHVHWQVELSCVVMLS